jgi:hypothetical protein
MDQNSHRNGFNRKIFFSFLVVGFFIVLWRTFPKAQKAERFSAVEEGTFEILVRNADGTNLSGKGFVAVDESCDASDRSEPTVTAGYQLIDGQAWRVRLFCPDRHTRLLNVRFPFMGTECTAEENPILTIPKSQRLELTVACSPVSSE